MTDKKILTGFYKLLFTIAIPIILQELLRTFVNMMDTIMVGRLGAVAIASVGLGNQIFFLLIMLIFGTSSGCAVFIAQYWGQRNIKEIRKTVGIMLTFSLAVTAVFTLACLTVPEKLIGLYSTDPEVISIGASYLRAVCISYPIMAITSALQMAYKSTEHVVLPMVTTAVSFALNILFNFIFIFGFEAWNIPAMGATGAAYGTVIARIAEFFITVIVGYYKKYEPCGSFNDFFSYSGSFVLKIFKIALPVILSECCWGLGISVQNGIFSHAGTDAFAAFSITNTCSQLTWVFFMGMGSAAAIILGKQIGAGEEEKAIAYTNRYSWFFPLCGAVIGLLLYPISLLTPKVFNVEPHIISITQSLLYLLMFMYPFRAYNMLLIVGILRSGGDTVFGSLIDNGFMWTIAIPLGCAATFFWHLEPWQIFLCLETEQFFKMGFGFVRVRSGKWLHRVTD